MQSPIDISEFKYISSHDKDAWQKLVTSWEAGNESQTQFCQDCGLNKNTFCYWRSKFLKMTKKKPMMGFKLLRSAETTNAGIELHDMLKKGQHKDAGSQNIFEKFYALAR